CSYKITKEEIRIEVYPSTGYHKGTVTTLNQKELAAKGYMQSPNDWKNVEMTGYVKLISSPSDINSIGIIVVDVVLIQYLVKVQLQV
ncbi:MAG: hypothetical protein ACJ71H_10525, partial [Nitrososphaeraceae archaeon]